MSRLAQLTCLMALVCVDARDDVPVSFSKASDTGHIDLAQVPRSMSNSTEYFRWTKWGSRASFYTIVSGSVHWLIFDTV